MEIKQLKSEIKLIAVAIHDHKKSVTGSARNYTWQSNLYFLKVKARMYLLAYAMLRGVPYKVAEGNAKPLPKAWSIANVFVPNQLQMSQEEREHKQRWETLAAAWLEA